MKSTKKEDNSPPSNFEARQGPKRVKLGSIPTEKIASRLDDAIRRGEELVVRRLLAEHRDYLAFGTNKAGKPLGWAQWPDDSFLSPIEMAAAMRHEDIFIQILNRGASDYRKLMRPRNAPRAPQNSTELAAAYLGVKAFRAAVKIFKPTNMRPSLLFAIRAGNIEVSREIIANETAQIPDVGPDGESLLAESLAYFKNTSAFSLLLSRVSIDVTNSKNEGPIMVLLRSSLLKSHTVSGQRLLYRALRVIAGAAEPSGPNQLCPLHLAARLGLLEAAKIIMEFAPQSIGQQTIEWNTPLMEAILGKDQRLINYLVGVSSLQDIASRNKAGMTALHAGALHSQALTLTLLLSASTAIRDIRSHSGKLASDMSKNDAIRSLIDQF